MSEHDKSYEKLIEDGRGAGLATEKRRSLEERPSGLARTRFCSISSFSTFRPSAQTRQSQQTSGPWNSGGISLMYSLKDCYVLDSPLLLNTSSEDTAGCSTLYPSWEH